MDHYDSSPGTVLRLRRGAHEFLRHYAAKAWEHEHKGERWEIVLPPEVEKLPSASATAPTPARKPSVSRMLPCTTWTSTPHAARSSSAPPSAKTATRT